MARSATRRSPSRWKWSLACVLATWAALARAQAAADTQASPRTYLGHHVVMGSMPVAVIGDVETRTDTWALVTLTRSGDVMRWQQRTCRISMAPVAGVRSSLPPAAVPKLPRVDARFDRGEDGVWHSGWDTGWTEHDLDGDGFPGVSIRVEVPLCAGYVYVAAHTHTQASASWVGEALLGELHVTMRQRILGASNWCLRLGPKQQHQTFVGVFRLEPARGPMRNVTNCDSIAQEHWPAAMQNPRSL